MMRPTMRSISAARTARLSVDADSRPWLLGFWWCARPNGYAATDSFWRWRGQRGRRVSLHVVVMNRVGVTDGCWIDHISGDKRDSRRANLRVVPPPRGNAQNRTLGTGVRPGRHGAWRGQVGFRRVHHTIGSFTTRAQAGEAVTTAISPGASGKRWRAATGSR